MILVVDVVAGLMVMGNDMGVAHELIGVKVYVVVPAMLVLMVTG